MGTKEFGQIDETPRFLVDGHVHVMTQARISGGVRWLKKLYPDVDVNLSLTIEKALSDLSLPRTMGFFNFFFPLEFGNSEDVNQWNYDFSQREPRAISFGSLHPDDPEKSKIIDKMLDQYKFAGLKFHPYIQNFSIKDPRMWEVYEHLALRKGLIIFHTGYAEGYKRPDLFNEAILLLEKYPDLTVVLSHLCWPRWEECFALLDSYPQLYLDSTNVYYHLTPASKEGELFMNLLEVYSDRVYYGTDYPLGFGTPRALYQKALELCPAAARDNYFWRTAISLLANGFSPQHSFSFYKKTLTRGKKDNEKD